MKFKIKREGKKDREIHMVGLEDLAAFIIGADAPVKIQPNWKKKYWELEVLTDE